MKVLVLVKHVPDTNSERQLDTESWTLDRAVSDGVIDEIDAKGVETALQLVETHGGSVTVATMGPEMATDALRKALAMGADRAIHVADDALAGSDAVATSAVLGSVVRRFDPDLVIAGNEATDGRTASVPAMIAERLGWPAVTSVRNVEVDDGLVLAERVVEGGWSQVSARVPAVISVNEKIGEPRYPSFKGIMAAKKKSVETLSTADLDIDPSIVGLAGAATQVVEGVALPPKAAGVKVTDDGVGAGGVVEYLISQRII
jgi:electron transfer flavoprotein beta subunit